MHDPSIPLPQVHAALAPYMHSRQETTRIRRLIATYLTSLTQSSQDPSAALPYYPPTSTHPIRVDHVPSDISGLRKEYLQALKQNAKARKDYQSLKALTRPQTPAAEAPRRKSSFSALPKGTKGAETGGYMQPYLNLLGLRRKYEKLRILQDYIDTFSSKDAARSEFLSLVSIEQELPPRPEPSANILQRISTGPSAESPDIAKLKRRLETAVLKAKHNLDVEQQLFAEAKAEWDSEQTRGREPTAKSKHTAVIRTREALIAWIENELANSQASAMKDGDDSDAPQDSHLEDSSEIEMEHVVHSYDKYIQARKTLLAALSASSVQSPSSTTDGPGEAKRPLPQRKPSNQTPMDTTSTPSNVIHQYMSERVLLLGYSQRCLLQQKAYLTTTLARHQKQVVQSIERLADESHLLATYPKLSIRHDQRGGGTLLAARALGKEKGALSGDSIPRPDETLIEKARMWTFACDEARRATSDAVEEHVGKGTTNLESAKAALGEIRLLTGEARGDDMEDGEDDGDIWAASEQTGSKKAKKTRRKAQVEYDGPWRGLDGQVGLASGGGK